MPRWHPKMSLRGSEIRSLDEFKMTLPNTDCFFFDFFTSRRFYATYIYLQPLWSNPIAFGPWNCDFTENARLVDEGESRNTTAHVRNTYCKRCGLFCTTGSTVDQDMCPFFQWKPGEFGSGRDRVSTNRWNSHKWHLQVINVLKVFRQGVKYIYIYLCIRIHTYIYIPYLIKNIVHFANNK